MITGDGVWLCGHYEIKSTLGVESSGICASFGMVTPQCCRQTSPAYIGQDRRLLRSSCVLPIACNKVFLNSSPEPRPRQLRLHTLLPHLGMLRRARARTNERAPPKPNWVSVFNRRQRTGIANGRQRKPIKSGEAVSRTAGCSQFCIGATQLDPIPSNYI